jgi:dihydrofolate synthase/folylpolyglutamate synthase
MALSYPESVAFLYSLQKHGVKLGLERIGALLRRLGVPHERYPSLHIGGTNGKGSTAAMAAAILEAAGYRVGLYTSPHLVDFRERIRVNGQAIPEDTVAELTETLQEALGEECPPTFFEFTTALAFQYFAEMAVDVSVIEVGLGGRFDATNVLTPLASVITTVALDHRDYLGETIGAIAFEKAGIVKPGVPVVTGRLDAEAEAVIAPVASAYGSAWARLGVDFRTEGDPCDGFAYHGLRLSCSDLRCPLPGRHQLDNAACALAALEQVGRAGLRVPDSAIRAGLAAMTWEGRLERVEEAPALLLDGAHNPAAAAAVADYLAEYRERHLASRVILVVGMMRDKDQAGIFRALLPLADEVVLTQVPMDRAAAVQDLRASLGEWAGPVHSATVPADALTLARRLAAPSDLICVTGSLMLVGEVKALLRGCGVSPIRG